ncbi:hypothetical protein PVAG01_07900 [Phlyctema vagabunda]|uniref:Uncharacterized protein n=1 Tax=Phlyctema vagabunda TaxID=108571 RepID=A0ABR4PDQ3_9HELO
MAAPKETVGLRRYSPDELLSLRESLHVVYCPVERFHQPSALEIILRIPKEALENPNAFYCTTQDLVEEYKRFRQQLSAFPHRDRSTEQICADGQMYQQQDRDAQQVHWLLRGRDNFGRTGQPYSAPTNLAAQQSENFQRFYRAVVSPTHIRVTAGGRIVPNTRTPPVFEWNRDKFHFEPRQQQVMASTSQTGGLWPHPAANIPPQQPLVNSATAPAGNFIHGFQPIYNEAHVLTPSNMPGHGVKPSSDERQSPLPNERSQSANPQPVKISPPSQFDQGKPFMYNGHLVYPAPPGFQPPPNMQALPLSVLGTSPMVTQAGPSVAFPIPHHHPIYAGNPLGLIPAGQHHPMMLANGANSTPAGRQPANVQMAFPANALPAMPVSELTKLQLQNTRAQIKQMDDIITNSSQGDVAHLVLARQALSQAAEQMENVLHDQLNNGHADVGTSQKPEIHATMKSAQKAESSSNGDHVGRGEGTYNLESLGRSSEASNSEPRRKSRLSASAAMAPPFKPRQEVLQISSTQPITQGEFSRRDKETVEQSEARLLAAATSDWTETEISTARPSRESGPPTMQKSHTMHASYPRRARGSIATPNAYMKRGNTFHGLSDSLSSAAETHAPRQGVPYLVGTNDYSSNQLTYPRELTDEEVRARHLYWGRAPRSAQKGLPKFDGKDFYPPSPVKEHASPVVTESPVKSLYTERVLDFSTLFSDNPASPFKSPSTPVPEHVTMHNTLSPAYGAGFKSPISRSSGHLKHHAGYNEMLRDFSISENRTYDKYTSTPQSESRGKPTQHLHGDPMKLGPQAQPYGHNGNNDTFSVDNNTPGMAKDDNHGLDPWVNPKYRATKVVGQGHTSKEQTSTDVESDTSTVEIHLTPQNFKHSPPIKALTGTFAERIAAVNNPEQQTKFLQDMLRNTAKAAPALSGSISNMTAHGYLPQYRGYAAASLAPSMNHSPAEHGTPQASSNNASPLTSSGFMSENRPLHDSLRGTPGPMSAEEYMRLVNTMPHEADCSIFEDSNIAKGTGPVAGSDW